MKSFKKLAFVSVPLLVFGLGLSLSQNQKMLPALAATTPSDTYSLLDGAVCETSWGIYNNGAVIYGFTNGNLTDGSVVLKSFEVPTAGEYKAVVNYFAGSYGQQCFSQRVLNFIVAGRHNVVRFDKDQDDGSWSTARQKEIMLHLEAGSNTIKVQGEHGPDSAVNLDNVQIYNSSNELVATLEGEEGELNNMGIHGTVIAGFENRNRPGAYVNVNASKKGIYKIGIDYAAGPDNTAPAVRYLDITVNGKELNHVAFNQTGDWYVYTVAEVEVELEAGQNQVMIKASPSTDVYESSLNLRTMYVSLSGYQQALDFANEYLFMDTVPTTDQSSTANCATNYAAAVAAFNNLYDEGRLSFLTLADFQNARDRLSAWATANGQTFDPAAGTFSSNRYQIIPTKQNAAIIIAVSAFTAIASVLAFVLIKRAVAKKNIK